MLNGIILVMKYYIKSNKSKIASGLAYERLSQVNLSQVKPNQGRSCLVEWS